MVAATQHREQRAHDRFGIAMDAMIEGEQARTHDLSATGLLLQSRWRAPVGRVVWVTLAFWGGGRSRRVGCYARVMRIQAHGEGYDIALRLAKPLFG